MMSTRNPSAQSTGSRPVANLGLGLGTPAPWFNAAALDGNPDYAFSSVAGRAVLLLFFGSAGQETARAALNGILAHRDLFDDEKCCFFGITIDSSDAANGRIHQSLPGVRYFLDYDKAVSREFGACAPDDDSNYYQPILLLLDRQLRVAGQYALAQHDVAVAHARLLANEPCADDWAPVLMVPRVFEPQLCAKLVELYEAHGGEDSGFMRERSGKTVPVVDHSHKRRSDFLIEDQDLQKALMGRINVRLRPMIQRAFAFDPTRMERYIVACYDSASGGHFRPHRDNTTKGTAHRRFAVTINLNAGDYEGGDLRFPEYGARTYCAPTGGAIVFSCSLLHEATPVMSGRRFAFLPFLYDDAAAAIREENNVFLDEQVGAYRRV